MIAIIGAGITGLALGYHLQQAGIPYRIFEASNRVGGNLRSVQTRDCLLEKGPNSLLMNDRIHALLVELGLESEILKANPGAKYRYVLRGGKYQRLPAGPISFLFGSFFTGKEKRRIWSERKIASRSPEGESVDVFFRRRLGDSVADYLLNPFVAGIYAGNPRNLEMEASFPRFLEMEAQHGSIIRGFFKGGKKDQHRGIFSLKQGLESLPKALAERQAGHIELEKIPQQLAVENDGIRVHWQDGTADSFEKVVMTLPAHALAPLISPLDAALGQGLSEVYYPPVALVHTLWKKEQVRHALDGFGALHSEVEASRTLGTIFSSTVFSGRNPAGTVQLTSFVGGARQPSAAMAGEKAVLNAVKEDLGKFLGIQGEPIWGEVAVYEKAIPQYQPGIRKVWQQAQAWETKGLFLGGNWREGISVPNCLDNARLICEKLNPDRG